MLQILEILSRVVCAIRKRVNALALDMANCPQAFIVSARGIRVSSLAVRLALIPLADEPVSIGKGLHSRADSKSIHEVAFIHAAVGPGVGALAVFDIIAPLAMVDGAVGIVVGSKTLELSILNVALILLVLGVKRHPLAIVNVSKDAAVADEFASLVLLSFVKMNRGHGLRYVVSEWKWHAANQRLQVDHSVRSSFVDFGEFVFETLVDELLCVVCPLMLVNLAGVLDQHVLVTI